MRAVGACRGLRTLSWSDPVARASWTSDQGRTFPVLDALYKCLPRDLGNILNLSLPDFSIANFINSSKESLFQKNEFTKL